MRITIYDLNLYIYNQQILLIFNPGIYPELSVLSDNCIRSQYTDLRWRVDLHDSGTGFKAGSNFLGVIESIDDDSWTVSMALVVPEWDPAKWQ